MRVLLLVICLCFASKGVTAAERLPSDYERDLTERGLLLNRTSAEEKEHQLRLAEQSREQCARGQDERLHNSVYEVTTHIPSVGSNLEAILPLLDAVAKNPRTAHYVSSRRIGSDSEPPTEPERVETGVATPPIAATKAPYGTSLLVLNFAEKEKAENPAMTDYGNRRKKPSLPSSDSENGITTTEKSGPETTPGIRAQQAPYGTPLPVFDLAEEKLPEKPLTMSCENTDFTGNNLADSKSGSDADDDDDESGNEEVIKESASKRKERFLSRNKQIIVSNS